MLDAMQFELFCTCKDPFICLLDLQLFLRNHSWTMQKKIYFALSNTFSFQTFFLLNIYGTEF